MDIEVFDIMLTQLLLSQKLLISRLIKLNVILNGVKRLICHF